VRDNVRLSAKQGHTTENKHMVLGSKLSPATSGCASFNHVTFEFGIFLYAGSRVLSSYLPRKILKKTSQWWKSSAV
jgi:hypothetical protein